MTKNKKSDIIGKTIKDVVEEDASITLIFTDGTKQSIGCFAGDHGASVFFTDDED